MIAKLVVWDVDRNAALNKLIRCLEDYEVVGLPTNIDFLLTCAKHPTFRAGTVDTGFIDQYLEDLLPDTAAPTPADALALAGVSYVLQREQEAIDFSPLSGDDFSPWDNDKLAGFRVATPSSQVVNILDSGVLTKVAVQRTHPRDPQSFSVTVQRVEANGDDNDDAATVTAEPVAVSIQDAVLDGTDVTATMNSQRIQATSVVLDLKTGNSTLDFFAPNHFPRPRYSLEVQQQDLGLASAGVGKGSVTAPMPGKIIKVLVNQGDSVEAGAPLVVMEAMKMEHVLEAPFAGTVAELFTAVEDFVADSDIVVRLE